MPSSELIAYQACFVVEDVEQAVKFCSSELGWGPFQHFKIPSKDCRYKDWQGDKLTEVALGMAGRSQVELIRVHQGQDSIQRYQSSMGAGLQHLGVLCKDSAQAIELLAGAGGSMDDQNRYGEITFTFMNVPTGPSMIELLERGEQGLPTNEEQQQGEKIGLTNASGGERMQLDRATIVTADLEQSLAFYAHCFPAKKAGIQLETLRITDSSGLIHNTKARRCLVNAGVLELELVEVSSAGTDPYAKQMQRSIAHAGHGLVHVGGKAGNVSTDNNAVQGEWLNSGELFTLRTGPDARLSLQLRH
ncbi:MAG: VOC family protein [Pseudomonadales bacterium]